MSEAPELSDQAPQDLHAQQIAFWNGPGGASWVAGQTRMDAALAPIAAAAIAHAGVKPGERVLDVGCGCGFTTLALAEAVGLGGHVTGLDVSAPMLGLAESRSAGLTNVNWLLDDAATHVFAPASRDLVFSRFGVMFFGDPVAAFANLRQALKPTGRLVFACWRPFDQNPWMRLPLQAALSAGVPPLPRTGPDDPGPFAFADPERVRRILTGAGFGAPAFKELDIEMTMGGGLGLAEAVEQAVTTGPASRALQGQPEALHAAARAAIETALAPYLVSGAVRLPAAIWLVSAAPA